MNACIGIFNILNIGKIIEIQLISNENNVVKIEIKNHLHKSYYFITDEYGKVVKAIEGSLDGKIIYTSNDDKIDMNNNDILKNDYIVISSTGYFSKKKFNNCFINLNDCKIYNITFDNDGKNKYEFYKELSNEQKNKLLNYIKENDLLNVSINNIVFDASDIIEINISGHKNVIRNASKEFTRNEMHIFDDIVDIVFNNNHFEKIKNFFSMNLKNDKNVTEFANKYGYNGAKYVGDWKEYKVYEPYMDEQQVSYIGLPMVILVNDKGEIRMSTSDEAMIIQDDKSFMVSYEKNKINKETPIDFGDNGGFIRKYKIDENRHEYEEIKKLEIPKCPKCNGNLLCGYDSKKHLYCDTCRSNYIDVGGIICPMDTMSGQDIKKLIVDIDKKIIELENEQEIIDKKITENFDEVSKYSILNKSLEELVLAKKKFIEDWYLLLFNSTNEKWIFNSGTYRIHIHSIIDAILRRKEDVASKLQLELLNQVGECLKNQNKDKLIAIVNDMKKLN